MKKLKEILARIDAVDVGLDGSVDPEEHNAILFAQVVRYEALAEDLEEAVREHLVALEKALTLLRAHYCNSYDHHGREDSDYSAVRDLDLKRLEGLL